MATALSRLMSLPVAPFALPASPLIRLTRLEQFLGPACPQLFAKRDDLLPIALGGNKVRKLALIAADAAARGADALVTCGTVTSNHARVTAAVGAMLGWRVILVLDGQPDTTPTANLFFDRLFGAEVTFIAHRNLRGEGMQDCANRLRAEGHRPYVIPVGGSMPLGAMAMARAVSELAAAGIRPDLIVHPSSSGGTQAGLIAGTALLGSRADVLGVSPDVSAQEVRMSVTEILSGVATDLGAKPETVGIDRAIDVDELEIGDGYGRDTPASREALEITARTEGFVLSSIYGAKAMASLLRRIRRRDYPPESVIVFWNTGGPHER